MPQSDLTTLLLQYENYYQGREIPKSALWEMVISFAYGNLAIENPTITKEMVEREYDQLNIDSVGA